MNDKNLIKTNPFDTKNDFVSKLYKEFLLLEFVKEVRIVMDVLSEEKWEYLIPNPIDYLKEKLEEVESQIKK